MKWFLNLKTHSKLLLGLSLIFLFLMVVIVNSYQTISDILASKHNLIENEFRTAVAIRDIRSNQNGIRADLLSIMLAANAAQTREFENGIQTRSEENSRTIEALLDKTRDSNPAMYQKLRQFVQIRDEFTIIREDRIFPLIREQRLEEAKALVFGEQLERDRQLRTIADELVELTVASAEAAVNLSEQQAQAAANIFITFSILTVLFCMAIVVILNRVVALPLRELSNTAEQIAAGDLTSRPVTDNRLDEVGILRLSFGRMIGNLSQVMREIHEATNILASAAGEIVATTSQVASGTTETATAITETTATVEEVKKTAELSSDKARYVSETAQKAVQVSHAGKEAVEQSIEGITHIRQQMQDLATSIVQLSEQSQSIAEIIATVNDLAEQSNLLAVNAAIEAAKAGEHGKGFGVVAQEIKSLAEQSKQATAQVRGILGNIQKATSASVLAAEKGSKLIEAGVKQTVEAGESIKVLTQSINEAAQAATQIAASSRQQQVGMDQVALAIENIRQASSQNVAGTKQAEIAAHDLSALGQKLKSIIEEYRV